MRAMSSLYLWKKSSAVSPCASPRILPGTLTKVSQIDGLLPARSMAPSICHCQYGCVWHGREGGEVMAAV